MRQINITPIITVRESASVESYLNDIYKIELINADQETELARRIKTGDQQALDQLVKTNLRFVVSVAKKYQHMGLPLPDLVSEGNLGLIRAAKRFDETRGFKFISFAVWWIREAMLTALAEQTRMIHLPMNQINLLTKVNRLSGEMENKMERRPTSAELAHQIGVSTKHIEDCCNFTVRTSSYDEPLTNEQEYTLLDTFASNEPSIEDRLVKETRGENIGALLDVLTKDERRVIELSFGIAEGYELLASDISRIMGLSEEVVLKIRKKAMYKLKSITANENPYTYLSN